LLIFFLWPTALQLRKQKCKRHHPTHQTKSLGATMAKAAAAASPPPVARASEPALAVSSASLGSGKLTITSYFPPAQTDATKAPFAVSRSAKVVALRCCFVRGLRMRVVEKQLNKAATKTNNLQKSKNARVKDGRRVPA
jgi:hypothetical protein